MGLKRLAGAELTRRDGVPGARSEKMECLGLPDTEGAEPPRLAAAQPARHAASGNQKSWMQTVWTPGFLPRCVAF